MSHHHHPHVITIDVPGFDAGLIRIPDHVLDLQISPSPPFPDSAFPGGMFPASIVVVYETPDGGEAMLTWLDGKGWGGFFDRSNKYESLGPNGLPIPHSVFDDHGRHVHFHQPSFSHHDAILFL
jgi:hypothetical protein